MDHVALLDAVAAGETVTAAVSRLHISRRTANRRLAEARRILGVRTTAEAVARWGAKSELFTAHQVPLSPREEQVMNLVAGGMTSTAIAGAVGVQPSTVESTVRNAIRKLSVPSRWAAVGQLAGAAPSADRSYRFTEAVGTNTT